MLKKITHKLNDFFKFLIEEFRIRVIRPIQKAKRKREYLKRQDAIQTATGELIDKFEPLLMHILNSALSDYKESVQPQNFYTRQAVNDIRRMYEIKLKSFISSKK